MSNENIETIGANREKAIVKTSIIGIITNVFLATFKAAVGIIANSIAVESVKKIISPETADYGTVSLIIISVAIVVKLILGQYVKRQGKKHNSGALVASGSDALFDAVLSASVLASAIIYLLWNISLEAYVGVIISAFIIKAGIEMMIDTVNDILGKRSDKEETDKIKNLICEEPEVRGAYDLILFNYGPNKNYGSVHIELPDTMSVDDIDKLTRRVETKVYRESGVILTGVGVYSYNTSSDEVAETRNTVQETVLAHDWALQFHGFYANTENKTMRFDVVISFDVDRAEALSVLTKEIKELFPDYTLQIVLDIDA